MMSYDEFCFWALRFQVGCGIAGFAIFVVVVVTVGALKMMSRED